MGYTDYIKDMLRPLRLYDLDEGFGAAEPEALGKSFDTVFAALEDVCREAVIPTAEDAGLARYEAILPYAPEAAAIGERRAAVMALLRIDGRSFTKSALNDTLAGCGIRASVEETAEPFTVCVRFPGSRGIPQGYDGLRARIEQILPCHLGVGYSIVYVRWDELEAGLASWAALEAACGTWDALEKYV